MLIPKLNSQEKILPDYDFRPLEEGDLDEIAQFEAEIAMNSFGSEAITDLDLYKKRLTPHIGKMGTIIAETNDRNIAGWAWVSSRKNATSGEVYGDFKSFYITKPHRGGDLTPALLSEVIEYGLRNQWSRLTARTSADNKAMQSVFDFFDFEAKHITYELSLERFYPPRKQKSNAKQQISGRQKRTRRKT